MSTPIRKHAYHDTSRLLLAPNARILIVRLRRLGDLLLLTPTLRALRQAYPQAQLDLLVLDGFDRALRGNAHLNRLVVLKHGFASWAAVMKQCLSGGYDAVVDFQSSPRSLPFVLATRAAVRIGWRKRGGRDWAYTHHAPGWDEPIYVARNFLRFAALVGVSPDADPHLEVAISDSDRQHTAEAFAATNIDARRPIIALSVVSTVDRKRWAAERYAELADHLIDDHKAQLVFTNGPGEIEQVRAVVERMQQQPALWNYGSTSLGGLASIYERCHLWIGNDGGAKHIASAAGCPSLVIIKAGDERFWSDTSDPHQRAVCDPQPYQRDPDSLAGIQPAHVIDAVIRMGEEGGWVCPTTNQP